jgi:hypothetical protein
MIWHNHFPKNGSPDYRHLALKNEFGFSQADTKVDTTEFVKVVRDALAMLGGTASEKAPARSWSEIGEWPCLQEDLVPAKKRGKTSS